MALEVGIVGLPSCGKSMLFEALTGAKAHGEVGMAAIPDPRLQQLADVVHARKVTAAAVRVVEVRGTGPALLGNLRQTACFMGGDAGHLLPSGAQAHAAGLAVHPYTFRVDQLPEHAPDADAVQRALFETAGVDGLFTDFCDVTLAFLGRRP